MSKPPAASASPVRKDKPAATPSSAAPPVVAPAVAAGAGVNCWILIIPVVGLFIAFGAGVYHRISLTLDLNHMADPINTKTGRWIPLQYDWKDGDLMEGSNTARWIGNVSLQHLNGDAYETENNERHCVFQTSYVPAGNSAATPSTKPAVDFKSKGFEDIVAVRPNIAIGCAGNLGSAFNNASMGSVGLNTPSGSCIVVRIPPSGDCTGDAGCEDKSSKNEPKLAINELPVIGLPIFEGDGKTIAFHPHGVYHLLSAENDVNPTWDVLFVINHAFDRGGERIDVFNITNLDANTPEASPIQLVYLYSVVDPFVQQYMMGNLDDIVATSATEVFLTTWHERPDNVRGAAFDGTGGVAIQLEDVAARLVGLPLAYLVHCTWSVDKSSKGVIVPGSSSCRAVATKFYIGNGISRASGLLARLRPDLRDYLFAVDTAGKTVHLIQLAALRRKVGAKMSSEDQDDRPDVSALNEWISVHLLGNAPVVPGFAHHRQSVYAYRTLDNIEFDKFDVDAYGKDSTTLHFFTGSLIRGLGLNDPSVSTRLSITVPPVVAAAPTSDPAGSSSHGSTRSLQITRVAQQDIGLTKDLLSVSGSTLLRNGDRRVVVSGAWNNTGLFSCTLLPQKP